jgi:hypothetical protein
MILEQIGEVKLPARDKPGGFDHAAGHRPRGRLYVAHTANAALDVLGYATAVAEREGTRSRFSIRTCWLDGSNNR